MNFFDFLMAMSRNNPGGMSYGRDPRSTRVSFPIQQMGMADTGFMGGPLASLLSNLGPAGASRNAAQQGLVGGQLPGLQFNGGGGAAPDIPAQSGTWFTPGEAPAHLQAYYDRVIANRNAQQGASGIRVTPLPTRPMQAMPAPPVVPPQLVGGPLPGIQYQPPAQTNTRNTRTSAAPAGASSRNTSGGGSSTYNNLLSRGYQPLQFGGG